MQPHTLVVTPVYCSSENERLSLLLQSIYWMQQQTDRDFVHVIVDDGSTDETPELLDRLALCVPQLRIYHKSNGGSSSAVNFGVEESLKRWNPKFITVTHSDDLLTPRSLEMRVDAAQKNRAKMVYTDMILLNERIGDAFQFSAPLFHRNHELYHHLLSHRNIPYPTLLWERDFFINKLQGYDSAIISAEDWDITLRSARELEQSGETFTHISRISAVNRQHDHNLWIENVRNGNRWKCYQIILAKHVRGWAYRSNLSRASLQILRAVLPEQIKSPLRVIKQRIFPSERRTLNAEDQAFLKAIYAIDYPIYFAELDRHYV